MYEDYLTAAELAALWKVSVKTLANWHYEGHGPAFVKIRGAVRYHRNAVNSYPTVTR